MYEGLLLVVSAVFLPKRTVPYFWLARRHGWVRNRHTLLCERLSKSITQTTLKPLLRTLILPFTQPVIQVMVILLAYIFDRLCIMLSPFETLGIDFYGQSEPASNLNYITLVTSYITAAQLAGALWIV